MLTDRQRSILDYIMEYRREQGCSPSIPEMQRHFGIRSPNGIAGHLRALEAKGYVRRSDRGSRRIDVVHPLDSMRAPVAEIPLFGSIPAGSPQEIAAHQPEGCVAVDQSTLGFRPGPASFALRVRGDSMKDVGILDGDIVIADASREPKPNQIVVALIDGENTLKRLVRVDGNYFLKAENPAYPDLTPRADLQIQGVVRTVIRQV
jgi:repressor LexA